MQCRQSVTLSAIPTFGCAFQSLISRALVEMLLFLWRMSSYSRGDFTSWQFSFLISVSWMKDLRQCGALREKLRSKVSKLDAAATSVLWLFLVSWFSLFVDFRFGVCIWWWHQSKSLRSVHNVILSHLIGSPGIKVESNRLSVFRLRVIFSCIRQDTNWDTTSCVH